jgi:CelD/BcsL family acetyltransferase involved in cellulose biosynthesis
VREQGQAELIGETLPGDDRDRAWRRLAELRSNPFLTPDWYRAWLRANPAEEPFAIAWRCEGELRGVLPLVRVPKRALALLRFAGARRGDWFTPACDAVDEPAMAVACAAFLRREKNAWGLLCLDRVDRQSSWPQALWAHDGGVVAPAQARRTDALPFIEFGDGGYQEYLAGRSRNFRSQLGRRKRRLEREQGLSFRMTTDAGQLGADFDAFFRLHDERWGDRGGSSSAAEGVRAFQREFAAAALERGWLRLWIAEAGGAPAAAWYGWRVGRRYCYSLSGLSKEYEPLGLGTVLLAHTIEQAAAEGAEIYDMMWGEEPYKRRFETGRRDAATWILCRPHSPLRFGVEMRNATERRLRGLRGH